MEYTNKAGGKYLVDIGANKIMKEDFISKRIYKTSSDLR